MGTSGIIRYPGAADAETYEIENQIVDPDKILETHIWSRARRDGRHLEIGAGSGFHAVGYAEHCAHVYALEPDPDMLVQMHRRLAQQPRGNISVLAAGAESISLPDASVDSAIARFAYFFGNSNCEPGLAELRRVLAPGGRAFLIDNDVRTGLFGELCKAAYPHWAGDAQMEAHAEFYAPHGFTRTTVQGCWRAPDRETLRRVLAMEFPGHEDAFMERVDGVEISYGFGVWVRAAP